MSVTCLGCGCGCDDLIVRVQDRRIVEVSPPCPLAERWFGDGVVPADTLVSGRPAAIDEAIEAAATLLSAASRPAVWLAPDLSTQAQRVAIGIADLLGADLESATSDTAAAGILAAQRRGRAAATLGELKNRADVVLFWAVDPTERYPRYLERYAAPTSTMSSRDILSVSVGADRGPADAQLIAEFSPAEEVDALAVMATLVRGQRLGELPERLRVAQSLAERLVRAKYVAIVHDGEPGREARDPQRADGLISLTQLLNGPTRAMLSTLRAGGNRSGAEAALTWQTGYPLRVTFMDGHPRARKTGVVGHRSDGVLVAGAAAAIGDSLPDFQRTPAVIVGPRASETRSARVAIDTGVAGIHEPGTGYRMDDVPLPLTPVLETPRGAAESLARLLTALRARRAGGAR